MSDCEMSTQERAMAELGLQQLALHHPHSEGCSSETCPVAAVADAARRYLELTAPGAANLPKPWPATLPEPQRVEWKASGESAEGPGVATSMNLGEIKIARFNLSEATNEAIRRKRDHAELWLRVAHTVRDALDELIELRSASVPIPVVHLRREDVETFRPHAEHDCPGRRDAALAAGAGAGGEEVDGG